MAIQNSINTVLGTVAAGVAGVSHLAEMEKSNQMNAAAHTESMSNKLVELANQGTEANKVYNEKIAANDKIMEDIRVSIKEDRFLDFKEEFYKNYKK